MLNRRALLFALAASSVSLAGPVFARADERRHGGVHHDDLARAVADGRALPLADVLVKLGDQLPGRLVRVEIEEDDGRLVYEFKVVDPTGRRRSFHVDALTAVILEEDD